jgi:putative PIN family toxin of toxin-antitoxin system
MTRAVIDTDVLVSALINPRGTPAKVLSLWRDHRFVLLISESILDEVGRVLAQPRLQRRYGLSPSRVTRLLRALRQFAVVVEGGPGIGGVVRDPEDQKFVDCAVAGRADYLVTGDDDLLSLGEHGGEQMISPAAFVQAVPPR